MEWGEDLPDDSPKRGRKASRRDEADLISAHKGTGVMTLLAQLGMMEEIVKC